VEQVKRPSWQIAVGDPVMSFTHEAVDGKEAVAEQTGLPPMLLKAGSGPDQELGGEGPLGDPSSPPHAVLNNKIAISAYRCMLFSLFNACCPSESPPTALPGRRT
jgi:hypothetical protein